VVNDLLFQIGEFPAFNCRRFASVNTSLMKLLGAKIGLSRGALQVFHGKSCNGKKSGFAQFVRPAAEGQFAPKAGHAFRLHQLFLSGPPGVACHFRLLKRGSASCPILIAGPSRQSSYPHRPEATSRAPLGQSSTTGPALLRSARPHQLRSNPLTPSAAQRKRTHGGIIFKNSRASANTNFFRRRLPKATRHAQQLAIAGPLSGIGR